MLQNARVTAFTVSELLRENQQGGITPHTQVRVKKSKFVWSVNNLQTINRS